MAARAPAPSVLVIACVLVAAVSAALLAGVASAAPGLTPADQQTPRGNGSDRAGTPPGNATDRAASSPGNVPVTPSATPTGPPTALPVAPPGVANATGDAAGDDNGGSGGFLGGIGQWFAGLVNALSNPLATFQGYARKMLQLLVERPIPTRNGDPAWFTRPDGPVMGAVYDITWTHALPIAILLSALYAGLATGMRGLVPPSVVPNRQATGAVWKSLGSALHVLLGWTIMVGWMVVVHGVAAWLAPSGVQILPSGQSILEQVVSGGLGGYLLWASSGVLAVLLVIVWTLSWLGALVAPPAYPLLVAAKPPDVPVLRRFRMLPNEGLLVALVAMPVPTAMVLGFGYPIINTFRTATTGPIATLGGLALTPLLTLVMWVIALVAPLLMLKWTQNMRPVAVFAASALGAASAMAVRDRIGRLPDTLPNIGGGTNHGAGAGGGGTGYGAGTGGGGTTMDPLEGSPFQHSSDGGFGGTIGGDGGSGAAPLGGGTGAEQGAGVGTGMAAASSTSRSGTTGPGPSGGASIGERSRRVGSVDEIPDGQRYEIGFETSDGEWQPVEDDTYSREFLFEGDDAFSRIDGAVNADTLYARGVQDAETYEWHP